jgi:anaerobic magnesium-protoporphyrin IX monomethyl ester cyclase
MAEVQLIKAPGIATGMPEDKWYVPLNLLWIASYLEMHGYTVEILDGQYLTLHEIKDRLHSRIVGISFDVLSVQSFNSIVRHAKNEKGCTIVAGGQYATPLACQILEGNSSVDFVVRYDGEKSLLLLAKRILRGYRIRLEEIPNLVWRDNGAIKLNVVEEVDLKTLPLPRRDSSGIDLEKYIASYSASKAASNLPFYYKRPTNAYSIKGCPRRSAHNGCSFCSRIDTRVRCKSPEQAFEEFKYLEREFSIDYISDFSDNWVIPRWLRQLSGIYERYGGLGSRLRVYADPRDINDETVLLLKELGVDTVLLGIESGDREVLRRNGKNVEPALIVKAVNLLAKQDIKISDAYVLGLIGETRASLDKTVDLARIIRGSCTTEISYWNILTPLPGSKAWNLLMSGDQSLAPSMSTSYEFDTVLLERKFISRFTELGESGYEYLVTIREAMLDQSTIPSREFIPAINSDEV